MDELTSNMAAIMDLSDKISGTLQGRRQQITKLAGVHTLLKKVHCLTLKLILMHNNGPCRSDCLFDNKFLRNKVFYSFKLKASSTCIGPWISSGEFNIHVYIFQLQFLFELPAKLQKCIEMEAYSSAVRYI